MCAAFLQGNMKRKIQLGSSGRRRNRQETGREV